MRAHPIGLDQHDFDGSFLYADSPVVTPDQAWEADNQAEWSVVVPWEVIRSESELRAIRSANASPHRMRKVKLPSMMPYRVEAPAVEQVPEIVALDRQYGPPPCERPPEPKDDTLLLLGRHIRMWAYLRPPMAGWLGKADSGFRGRAYP